MLVALMVAGCADSTRPDALQHAQLGTDCKACEAALSQERMGSRTLARTMATDLCAASLKEAGEMRASVRELRHELQRTQKKLRAYKRAYERQSNSASVPNEERGSPLRLWKKKPSTVSGWCVRFVQRMQQPRRRRPKVLPILPSPGASSKNHLKVRIHPPAPSSPPPRGMVDPDHASPRWEKGPEREKGDTHGLSGKRETHAA